MAHPKVYFSPVKDPSQISPTAGKLFALMIQQENLSLQSTVPLKIHTSEPGNISFIRPEEIQGIKDFLRHQGINTYYLETNTAAGIRETEASHRQVAQQHGFTDLPFVIADAPDGFTHKRVPVPGGKHFKHVLIASHLAKLNQVIVICHFKGHIKSGFGGAIKMLGLGFASGRGKTLQHAKVKIPRTERIDWSKAFSRGQWNSDYVYHGVEFMQRSAEYALAAAHGKSHLYVLYAIRISQNCDCDGQAMDPIYEDLGIFASTDPVAIDKAAFDLLEQREGKKPFFGREIFPYAESIGLGSTQYRLVNVSA